MKQLCNMYHVTYLIFFRYNCDKNNDDYSKNSYDDQQSDLIIRAGAFDFCEGNLSYLIIN